MAFNSNTARHNVSPIEAQRPQIDFTGAIWQALQHAPILQHGANGPATQAIDDWTGPLVNAADSKIVRVPYARRSNEVVSRTRAGYHGLLRQTCDILWPYPQVPQGQIEDWVEHEGEHGEACLSVNPIASVFYSVQINYTQETDGQINPSILPFVGVDGFLRKIDLAFVAVAPTRLSSTDLHVAHALGYESAEEVLERHGNLSAEYP
jgi:hypothetical protein